MLAAATKTTKTTKTTKAETEVKAKTKTKTKETDPDTVQAKAPTKASSRSRVSTTKSEATPSPAVTGTDGDGAHVQSGASQASQAAAAAASTLPPGKAPPFNPLATLMFDSRQRALARKHPLDTIRSPLVAEMLVNMLGDVRGKTFVDVNCGVGLVSRLLLNKGAAHVLGTNQSSGVMGHYMELAERSNHRFALWQTSWPRDLDTPILPERLWNAPKRSWDEEPSVEVVGGGGRWAPVKLLEDLIARRGIFHFGRIPFTVLANVRKFACTLTAARPDGTVAPVTDSTIVGSHSYIDITYMLLFEATSIIYPVAEFHTSFGASSLLYSGSWTNKRKTIGVAAHCFVFFFLFFFSVFVATPAYAPASTRMPHSARSEIHQLATHD
ncbi:hypothetical protein CAOG_002512 [Capsaspora owczarzaki ATCC 30864]|uniref:Uncharacterized protein n=1 Tax=Capsaspora owczarzaki (strain ATCC 30864) TaxID=595528 RepID=A0A0D2WMH5_CAPO3|nr:hypothetical protein CAOG_002512 [Capsaspora owczarzaki ATCC 30864]